jgi:tetratricopeptide (TPR) repeat protein
MSERYKSFDYEITDDPEFMNDKFGITPELSRQMRSIYFQAQKGGSKVIERITQLVEKYPHVPQLKNYLSAAYMNSGNIKKAREVNHWILKEHPDYLFGKLNLGFEYYATKQYEKIPEVIGNLMEIQDLYPERGCFYISEVTGFNKLAIMYFCAIGNLPAAESRYEIIEQLAPDHPDTEEVFPYLMRARLEAAKKRMDQEEKTRIRVKTIPYDRKLRKETKPEFAHKEIDWLYENDFRIDKEKLKVILGLPYKSLVSDLTLVLKDAIYRYDFFKLVADTHEKWPGNLLSFPLHAIYLLGELKAEEALNDILETFRQEEEFIEFWYGDFMTDGFWEPLYHIANKQLDELKQFVMSPGIWTYARTEIATCVQQIAFHQPERKSEVIQWFREVFRFMATASLKDNIIDSDFLGLAIWDALEIREPSLLLDMKELIDLGYVCTGICGEYDNIERDMKTPVSVHEKKELLNIYDRYNQVVTAWAGYKEEEESLLDEKEEPYHAPFKTGRNDPCPCGSGKKFKKCCFEKYQ